MLTKTNYLAYLQCPKQFWLAMNQPELAASPDLSAQRRFRIGQQVDRLACASFPNGRFIPHYSQPEKMAAATHQAIAEGATTLFQATMTVDDLLIRADILTHTGVGWHLIEVKSSTSVKEEHLPDAAFQVYVVEKAGVKVTQASIMHLNHECRHPDLSNLFTLTDVTAQIRPLLPAIPTHITHMQQLLAQETPPGTKIGRHCSKPTTCSFYDHCWQGIEGLTIHHIPRLTPAKIQQLETAGALYLADVPPHFVLTDTQRAFVTRFVQQQIQIDALAIQQQLAALQQPLYFLDFETIDHAIPVYDGCCPYQQVPFQYSCHQLTADGKLLHHEYLHTTPDDPRPNLVTTLLHHIGPTGHIVVYNATFERGILKGLAEMFPQYADHLQSMINRLWDQLDIFKHHYQHYQFGGSNSLKSVLPVVVPTLNYQELTVQNGTQAQTVWEQLIDGTDETTRQELTAQLQAYCHLDTLAMVELHRVLEKV